MLHNTLPRPSRGALRVLRQLALYGSFGTAAGSAAFLLEEQRRQICRLSRMAENGRKIKEFIRQAHSNATPVEQQSGLGTGTGLGGGPGSGTFARYVQSMEVKGLVTREVNSRNREVGRVRDGQADHYFTKIEDHPRRRRRKRTSALHGAVPIATQQRGQNFSLRRRVLWRGRPNPSAHMTALIRILSTLKGKSCRSTEGPDAYMQWERDSAHSAVVLPRSDAALDAFCLEIANRSGSMDLGAFEDFLAARISHSDFEPIQRLLDSCKAEFPWSKPLYPILLRSLAHVDKSAYLVPQRAIPILSLCRRTLAEGELEPVTSLMDLCQAKAFQLVIDIYRTLPPEKEWSRIELSLLLESALEALDAGSIDCEPMTRILRQYSNESTFATHVLPVLKYKVGKKLVVPVMRAYAAACCSSTDPRLLEYLEHLLSESVSSSSRDAQFMLDGLRYRMLLSAVQDPTCSEPWFLKLLSVHLAHQQTLGSRMASGPFKWRKITVAARTRGFYRSLIQSSQMYPLELGRNEGASDIAQAYLQLGKTYLAEIDAECLNRTIYQCFSRNSLELVVDLFREFQPTGLLTAGTSNCCWRAVLKCASTQEALALLQLVLNDEKVPVFLVAIENVQALLIRRTWVRTRNFDQVSRLYNSFASMIASYNETHLVKLLDSQILNAMISTCAKTGRIDEARKYAQMQAASQSHPTEQAVPHLTLLHAKSRNWTKVESLLDSMKRMKKMEVLSGYFFADLFQVYCEQHTAEEAYAFFRKCFDEWDVTPDSLMIDHLVATCMGGNGDLYVVRQLLSALERKGITWQIRQKTVIMAYQHYSRRWRPDGPVSVELLQTWNQHHHALVTKNLCLLVLDTCAVAARGYDVKATSVERRLIASQLRKKLLKQVEIVERIASSAPWLSERSSYLFPSKDWVGLSNIDKAPREASQKLYSQMQNAFSAADFKQVIAVYRELYSQNLPSVYFALDMAVIACLRLGHQPFAFALVQQAADAGLPIHNAQRSMEIDALSQPETPFRPFSYLSIRVRQAYRRMTEYNEPIRHDLLVAAAHHLTKRGKSRDAARLIGDVFGSKYERMQPFDIVVMSAWISAYGTSLDVAGVKWVVKKILEQDTLVDLHFFKTLHLARSMCVRALREAEKRTAANKVLARFQVYDALVWRRYQTQRIHGNAIGRKMVADLVSLKNINDQTYGRITVTSITSLGERIVEKTKTSIKKRPRHWTERQARLAADIITRQRSAMILRRKADRIVAWAQSEGSGVNKMDGKGIWRKGPSAPATAESVSGIVIDTSAEVAVEDIGNASLVEGPSAQASEESDFAISAWPTWNATKVKEEAPIIPTVPGDVSESRLRSLDDKMDTRTTQPVEQLLVLERSSDSAKGHGSEADTESLMALWRPPVSFPTDNPLDITSVTSTLWNAEILTETASAKGCGSLSMDQAISQTWTAERTQDVANAGTDALSKMEESLMQEHPLRSRKKMKKNKGGLRRPSFQARRAVEENPSVSVTPTLVVPPSSAALEQPERAKEVDALSALEQTLSSDEVGKSKRKTRGR